MKEMQSIKPDMHKSHKYQQKDISQFFLISLTHAACLRTTHKMKQKHHHSSTQIVSQNTMQPSQQTSSTMVLGRHLLHNGNQR